MKIISFVSIKGGVGKTTLVQGLCSALLAQHYKVTIIDMTQMTYLEEWHSKATSVHGSSQNSTLLTANSDVELLQCLADARRSGTDVVLIDTDRGLNALCDFVVDESNLVIIPSKSTIPEFTMAIEALVHFETLLNTSEKDTKVALLETRMLPNATTNPDWGEGHPTLPRSSIKMRVGLESYIEQGFLEDMINKSAEGILLAELPDNERIIETHKVNQSAILAFRELTRAGFEIMNMLS